MPVPSRLASVARCSADVPLLRASARGQPSLEERSLSNFLTRAPSDKRAARNADTTISIAVSAIVGEKIGIDEFAKVDLRVAKVMAAEPQVIFYFVGGGSGFDRFEYS